jgi:hypothetical protein
MKVKEHPKPRIFGKGYGSHVVYHGRLFLSFTGMTLKVLVTMFLPKVYHESYHWKIIEYYHKLRGYRHGEHEQRCSECGRDMPSSTEVSDLRKAEERISELHDENVELKWTLSSLGKEGHIKKSDDSE